MIILAVILALALLLSLLVGVATAALAIPVAIVSAMGVSRICKPSWKLATVNKLAILLIPTLTVLGSILIRLLFPNPIAFGDHGFLEMPSALSADLIVFSSLTGFGTAVVFMVTRIENRESRIDEEYRERIHRNLEAIARDAQ